MTRSDIKECGRTDVHPGHHWYKPIPTPPLAAYGLTEVSAEYESTGRTVAYYCRGDNGIRQFNVTVTIQPEPGTRGPFGGEAFNYRGVIEEESVRADVVAHADSVATVLEVVARTAAQHAVHRYHEEMIKELDLSQGQPYLDERGRAEKRYQEWRRQGERYVPADSPAARRVLEIVSDANARQLQRPVYHAGTYSPEYGWARGLDIQPCVYCGSGIVHIEPEPGYSEWTSNVSNTAGQQCPSSPSGFHAPPAEPTEDTAY